MFKDSKTGNLIKVRVATGSGIIKNNLHMVTAWELLKSTTTSSLKELIKKFKKENHSKIPKVLKVWSNLNLLP